MGISQSFIVDLDSLDISLNGYSDPEAHAVYQLSPSTYCWVNSEKVVYRTNGRTKVRDKKEFYSPVPIVDAHVNKTLTLLLDDNTLHGEKETTKYIKRISRDDDNYITVSTFGSVPIPGHDNISDVDDAILLNGNIFILKNKTIEIRPYDNPRHIIKKCFLNEPCRRIETFGDNVIAVYDDDRVFLG